MNIVKNFLVQSTRKENPKIKVNKEKTLKIGAIKQ